MPHFVLLKKQRAVGHGFFHEAVLRAVRGTSFRWIYDCGGGRTTKGQVEAYLQETRDAPVDILFLSHLHTDHVSGLPQLLKRTKVRRAFIPHTSKTERVLVSLAVADGSMRPWLVRFLADPAAWLRDNGVDEVTEVVRGDERAADPRGPEERLDDPNVRVTVFDRAVPVPAGVAQVTDQAHILVQDETLALNFLLYVQPAKLEQVDGFLSKLATRGLAPLALLSKKDGLRALRLAYEAGWKDINWTSLCVACIPVTSHAREGHCWVEAGHGRHRRLFVPVERPGWLGLGDAVLKEPSEVALLKNHFGPALADVGMYSVPHHGFDGKFCDDVMYLSSTFTNPDPHVVRYATAREGSSKHPCPAVLRTLRNMLWTCLW